MAEMAVGAPYSQYAILGDAAGGPTPKDEARQRDSTPHQEENSDGFGQEDEGNGQDPGQPEALGPDAQARYSSTAHRRSGIMIS
jgi:hypothetical protein